jgi:general secretion pathway protein K
MYGWIEDMQSRFNLNNLVNDEGGVNTQVLQKFEYLLQLLELDPAIAEAIVDWIDPDSNASGRQGAEDIYYLGLSQPYMAANRPLLDEEELRLVRGIDQAAWNRLQPYICVLPEQTSININTAGPEVIAAALYNPDSPANLVTEIGNWVQDVQINPLSSLEEVKQQAAERLNISDVEGLDVRTGYFRAHTQMAFGNVEHRMSTLYRRAGGRATILQHSRTLF